MLTLFEIKSMERNFVMKKAFLIAAVMFAAFAVQAQKPIKVAISKDISAPVSKSDKDNSINNLMVEYFKSELASHSGLKIVTTEDFADYLKSGKDIRAGQPFTAEQLKTITQKAGSDLFAVTNVARATDPKEPPFTATVTIYNADGTVKGTAKRTFDNVRQVELTSVILARDAAIAIRGKSAIDDINLEREKRLLKELEEYSKTEKGKRAGGAIKAE